MAIAVTTPTGQIGRQLVRLLIAAGERPRVVLRDPARLDPAFAGRVDVAVADSGDRESLARAFHDVDRLFWLTPPNYASTDPLGEYERLGSNGAAAAESAGIRRVVNLSSAGAQRRHGFGLIDGLGRIEEAFEQISGDVVHLRPSFFFENLKFALPTLAQGAIYYPLPQDSEAAYVGTRDIAEVATARLLSSAWSGKSALSLYGPENLSFAQLAAEVSAGVGRPIAAVSVTDEAFAEGLAQGGISPQVIPHYVQMFRAIRENPELFADRDTASTTPTTLREWSLAHLRPLLEA